MPFKPTRSEALKPGTFAPDFILSEGGGMSLTFYERYCGQHPVVLLFSAGNVSSTFSIDYTRIAARASGLLVVAGGYRQMINAPFPVFWDDGRITRAFLGTQEIGEELVVVILRPTLTVLACLNNPALEEIEGMLDRIPPPVTSICHETAPVLMVPDVLPGSLCGQLMAAHEGNHVESGMVRLVKGKPALVPDAGIKIRRDHPLQDPDLTQSVTDALSERVLPLVARAFHYRVRHLEGYKVVAYDSVTGGFFGLHRDNLTPDARHRRFALSLNLNDGYSGGEIIFPEFSATRYRPPAGGALVFSGTLLHAATEVVAGIRYVLLTFMWGDEGG